MPDVQLPSEIAAKISVDANLALETSFKAFVARRRDDEDRRAAQHEFNEAMIRTLLQDERLREAPLLKPPTLRHALATLQDNKKPSAGRLASRSPIAQALTMQPFNGGGSALPIGHEIPEDTMLQVLFPPYANNFTSAQPSGNPDEHANADAQTGAFGFLDGTAGGSAACSAGVWVQFIPNPPLPRLVEVRPYTPYDYQWNDVSQWGYTAHNNAGFGIYVLSWDMQGHDQRLEQDYRYAVWSDGTGWWDNHANPSSPDYDFGYAYLYGNEAPYFEAQPDRIYSACVWCFGTCDAGSGFLPKSIPLQR